MNDPYAPSKPASRGGWRWPLALVILAFAGGAALMAWGVPRFAPLRTLTGAGTPAAPLAVAPQSAPAAPAIAAPSLADARTDARVSDLEARMARIDLRAAAAAANAGRAEGLLVAFAARRALDRGTGLGYVEGQLRARFAETQPRAVAAVIAAGQKPVTIPQLRVRLDAIAPQVVTVAADRDWFASARRALGSMIVVRRESEPGTAPDERLMRARLMLDSGQVDGALNEVARLPARDRAAGWIADARRYIEAHRALDVIEAAAILPPADPLIAPTPFQPTVDDPDRADTF